MQAAEKTKPRDGTFLTAASPGVVALFQTNKHYSDHQQYVGALVPELAKEYRKGFTCSVLSHGIVLNCLQWWRRT